MVRSFWILLLFDYFDVLLNSRISYLPCRSRSFFCLAARFGLPEGNDSCLWTIAHGICKSYKFFTYEVVKNLQLRTKLLQFNRMDGVNNTNYNKQANLLVAAHRRLNDMVQQTRTSEVKKIRMLLKNKIKGT